MPIAIFLLAAALAAPAQRPPSGTLLIVNLREHNLLFLDPQSKTLLATVPDGVGNVAGHEITLSRDGHTAYIPVYSDAVLGDPGAAGHTIDVIDLVARRRQSTIDLGRPLRPHSAVFGADGLLYVTTELANAVAIVDTTRGSVVGEIPTGKPQSHMLVLSPDGRRGYTSNVDSGTVSVLDIPHRKLLAIIPVTRRIQRIAISPDGRWVFTSDWDAPRVAVIDARTNTVSRWIPVSGLPFAARPTPDGRFLLVVESKADKGHLDVIDLKTNKPVHAWDLDAQPFGIFIHDHIAYMTCIVTGRVEILNLDSWALEPPINLTPGVDGMAWLNAER
ncbi:MAG: cytochrome D1 domain-containing protein [Acidobacteriaceae bacterium]